MRLRTRRAFSALLGSALVGLMLMLTHPVSAQPAPCPTLPAGSPTGGTAGTGTAGTTNGTTNSTANLRAAPDARAAVIARIEAGAGVRVLGRDPSARWLYVQADGEGAPEGWLSAIVLCEADWAALPFYTTPTAVPAPSAVSTPSADSTPEATPPDGAPLVTAAAYGRVNVRSAPTVSAPVVAQLDAGDRVSVLARSSAQSDWLLIAAARADGTPVQGWVAFFTVSLEGAPDALPVLVPNAAADGLIAPSAVVRARFNARLHDAPALAAPTVAIVQFGTAVTPLARSRDDAWLLVSTQGAVGWGAIGLFDITPEAAAALEEQAASQGEPAASQGEQAASQGEPAATEAASGGG
jgi:uncharacterized protein YgiM (DUF1202 family)